MNENDENCNENNDGGNNDSTSDNIQSQHGRNIEDEVQT